MTTTTQTQSIRDAHALKAVVTDSDVEARAAAETDSYLDPDVRREFGISRGEWLSWGQAERDSMREQWKDHHLEADADILMDMEADRQAAMMEADQDELAREMATE